MTNNNFSQIATFIWSIADLLRGDFKQSQYGRVILPFTLLRRLECVLAPSKDEVLKASKTINPTLPEEAQEEFILKATRGLFFYNISEFSLSNLSRYHTRDNLYMYLASFSKNVRDIFEHFNFYEFIRLLDSTNLLFSVVDKMNSIDLSDQVISNAEMGEVFEELIRRFAESSNETAGEHFTPRDIVRLTTGVVFGKNDGALSKKSIIRTVYDPTVGTGGFLSSCSEYLYEHNPEAMIKVYGQEINPESYAICKADMMIKGQDVHNIKLGNSLSNDQFAYDKFDYMLSNPPFGMDWKKIEYDIKSEHAQMGFKGRFGAGLPRVSDSSLLFLMHLISKMRDANGDYQGSRIGIILNGSPLFTGSAGSGESEIRRYILEADLLEAIIALPTNMFFNTGIATYVWVLNNKKEVKRKGKVHLINATNLSSKMRKTLGSKRNYLTDEEIRTITQNYDAFEAVDSLAKDSESDQQKLFASKIFNSFEFGYRRVTIERPLRLSAQLTDERIESLRFATKQFNAVMQSIYTQFGITWTTESYGNLGEYEADIRALIKAEFSELKEKDIKTVLEPKLWLKQRALLLKAQALQVKIGTEQFDDFNAFDSVLKQVLKDSNIKFEPKDKEREQFIAVITWNNPDAEPVVNKVVKGTENPLYGQFSYKGKIVEFVQDGDLRDAENIPLDPSQSMTDLIESYFKREVQPYVPDAWINVDKRDNKDGGIGTVGYLIDFHRKFTKDEEFIIGNRNILRIKNLINTDKNGELVLNRYSGEIMLFSDIKDKSYSLNLTKFNVDSSVLNYQYYNIFLSLPEGKDWLESSVNTVSTIR
uniref:type I restriction-modification system subunit M n=1 Tax=Acinetobacter sp. P8-3-8 TaxID=1029823 RepID=UPI00024865A9